MTLKTLNIITEGKLGSVVNMVSSMSTSSVDDANFGKFVPKKQGHLYTLYLAKNGIAIKLVEYLSGGENPYVKFILSPDILDIVPNHLIGEITMMFSEIYQIIGKHIENTDILNTEVTAKRMGLKVSSSKTVLCKIGSTIMLDRKTPPSIEPAPKSIPVK